jgi:exopolysaccharide production protein ExoZ
VFGVALAQWTLRGYRLHPAVATALLIGGFVAILVLPMGHENLRVLTWGVPAFAIVAGAVSLELLIAPALPRWLLALGDASYSIYLSHGFVLPALMLLIGRFVSPGLWAEAVTIILSLVVSSIAGWVVYRVVEDPMLWVMRRSTRFATSETSASRRRRTWTRYKFRSALAPMAATEARERRTEYPRPLVSAST